MRGRDVCYHHGGKTPVSVASPHYKTGARSRYAPVIPRQLEGYFSLEESNLLDIQEDIRLHDSLIKSALSNMDRGESDALWPSLKEAWAEYQKAKKNRQQGVGPSPEEALAMVGFLITEGYQEWMSRGELRQMLQERAKLVEAEGKRLERAERHITVTQALVLMDRLASIVARHVGDPRALAAITGEFVALTGGAVQGGGGDAGTAGRTEGEAQ